MMRADMAAAYLDYHDTNEFTRAVRRGDAPSPVAYRGTGRARQPIWSRALMDDFAAPVSAANSDSSEDLASLV